MSVPKEERCSATVWDHTGFHRVPCSRRGKHEEEGKRWCGQHRPGAVAERAAKRRARIDAELESDRRRYEREHHQCEALELVESLVQWREEGSMPDLVWEYLSGELHDHMPKYAKTLPAKLFEEPTA